MFCKVVVASCISTSNVGDSSSCHIFHSHRHLVLRVFFTLVILACVQLYFTVVLISISPRTSNVKHIFMCLLAFVYLLGNVSSNILSIFLLAFFFWLSYWVMSSSCILNSRFLLWKILLLLCVLPLCFLNNHFWKVTLLNHEVNFIMSMKSIFSFIICVLVSYLNNVCLTQQHKDLLLET